MVCMSPRWLYFTVTRAPLTAELPEVTLKVSVVSGVPFRDISTIPR
jgi:hypothetical protein